MPTGNRSRHELLNENERLHYRLEEAEQTLQAICSGEVDAFVVYLPEGEKVFTLQGAEQPYRVLVETMNEGAAFLVTSGMVVYCNRQLADLLQVPMEKLTGSPLRAYVAAEDQALVTGWVKNPAPQGEQHEITLRTAAGNRLPVLFSCTTVEISGKPGVGVVVTDISQRKRVEDALHQSEIFVRTILNSVENMIAVIDNQGIILQVNESWQRFAMENGIEPGKPTPHTDTGNNYLETCQTTTGFWSEGAMATFDGIKAVLDRRSPSFTMEYPCHSPTKQRWFSMAVTPLNHDRQGAVITHTDITERKRIEEALRESESRFRTLANAAPVLIWVAGPDKLCHWFNQVWLDFTGRTLEQEQGNGWVEGVHPEDLSHCLEVYGRQFDRREVFQMEYRLRRHDGEYRWLLDHGVPLLDGQGSFAGYIGSCFDITPSKELTVNLHKALNDLNTQTSRLQTLLDNASDGIHILDMQGNLVQFSDSFAQMLGYAHAEIAKLSVADWEVMIPQAQQREIIHGLVNGPARFESKHRRKDGSLIEVEIIAKGVILEGVQYVYASARDITQRKALERELLASKAESEDLFDNAPCGYHSIGPDGIYVRINQTELEWLGCSRDEVIGKLSPADFYAPASKRRYATIFAHIKQDGHIENVEYDLVGKDGTLRHVSLSATSVKDNDGNFLMTRSVFYDITELTKARVALERLMCEQEAMLDNELVGIMKIKDRRAVWLNKAMEHLFGYAPGEMDGQSSRILFADDAAYHHLGETAYPIIQTHKIYRTQLEMVRKDGKKLWIDASGILLPNTDEEYLWMLADISLIKQYQDKIEHIAFHDNLTGLPNRLLIADRLHQALTLAERSGHLLAVCYFDLDGFKRVNDSFGHAAGDTLLIEIAHRLQRCIRADDTVGRLGGDEFVLLLTNLQNPKELSEALRRIIEAINQPVAIDAVHEATISASIGIALFPHDADPDTLLRHADQAMYVAKQSGRNRYCLFDVNQDAEMKAEQANLAGIRRALDRHEFVLHYQPQVNMQTGVVIGAEALIRWQDPAQGLLLPIAFLPILSRHPLCVELGEWVIDAVFAQLAEWQGQGFDPPVSVNIDARHLQSDGFALRLRARFAAHPSIHPGRLELEVLESSALGDVNHASKIMHACCESGVHFALDDFGTGYSSLTYLRHLPVDTLKIDQSFVQDMLHDPGDLSIVEGVIGLARAFRHQVIAEGVETAGHVERLLALGCDLMQGYAIAWPMTAAELPGWVAAWQQNWVGSTQPQK